jgi:hypothetical protein
VTAPLLVALLLAAPVGPAASQPAAGPAAAGQRVELTVRFPPWQFTGTFTLEGAGLSDRGVARDAGSLTGAGATVERVLTGEHGSLTLSLRGEVHAASFPALFGHWQVTGATGAYQGAAGGGTFTAADLGTGQGSPLELQALVGRLQVPRRPPAWRAPAAAPLLPAPALRPAGPSPER